MFDIGWSELLVIGVVLIVVVGPKDLPRMLRTFGKTMTQMRRMAGDFRKQFDEALKEAELDEVRQTVADVRSIDPTKDIRKAMNPMKAVGDEIRSSLAAATRAPEPKVPTASAPAQPTVPVVAGSENVAAPAMASNPTPAAPTPAVATATAPAQTSNTASTAVGPQVAAGEPSAHAPVAPVLNGSGAHINGTDAGGEIK